MTLKDLLNVVFFGEMIVKHKKNELRFNLDKETLENIPNIFAQEFLDLEVETVAPIDEYTLSVILKEK